MSNTSNNNNNRSRSSTSFSSPSNSQGGFGAFLKSFMGNSVHDTSGTNPLLEGEDINTLEKSQTSSSPQLRRSLSSSSQMSNSSSDSLSVAIPIETLDQHLDHLFETYPETMRSYSEHQFMDMLSKFTQAKENQPLSSTTTNSSISNPKRELLPLNETQKQNYFNKFIMFKYGNIKQLENGDFSRNSYIFKRMVIPTTQIKKITLRWGIYIDYLSISYSNKISKSFGTPTGGNDTVDIYLSDSEYIVKVSGYQREALMQIKFETNTGKIYGPYGNNTLTGAYPFISSGAYLKDLLVQEGKAGPTIFVKFHVVLSVCPEWSGLTPTFKTSLSECWFELSNIHEKLECLAKKSLPPTESFEDVLKNQATNNKTIGDFYVEDMIDFRRSIAKCYEILHKLNSQTENHFDSWNEKLYKSFVNLYFESKLNPNHE